MRAFDSEGRLLELVVPGNARPASPPRFGVDVLPLELHPVDAEPQHVSELRRELLEALEREGIPGTSLADQDLPSLVATAASQLGVIGVRRTLRQVIKGLLGSQDPREGSRP